MADNVPITAGSGTNIATDQLGTGEHVQFMKLMDGTLDSTTKARVLSGASPSASDGAVVVTLSPGSAFPTDDTGSAVLGALNAKIQIAVDSGIKTVTVSLPAGNNLVASIQAVAWFDAAGTGSQTAVAFAGTSSGISASELAAGSTASVSSTTGTYVIKVPPGATFVGMVVSVYTSGTVTATIRATQTDLYPYPATVVKGTTGLAVTVKAGVATLVDNALVVAPAGAKQLPTGATGLNAVPVWTNAIQMSTYVSSCRAVATGTLSAGTAKAIFSFEKTNVFVTVKIRRIVISGYQTTALAGQLDFQLNRGTAASTGGTAASVNGGKRDSTDGATICTMKSLPTITAASLVDTIPGFASPTTAATAFPFTVIYDWQEAGETKPWTLQPGAIDSLVINVISAAAQAWNLTCHIIYTEES